MLVNVKDCTKDPVLQAWEMMKPTDCDKAIMASVGTLVRMMEKGILREYEDNRGKTAYHITPSTKYPTRVVKSIRDEFCPKALSDFQVIPQPKEKMVFGNMTICPIDMRDGHCRLRGVHAGLVAGTITMEELDNIIIRVTVLKAAEDVTVSTKRNDQTAHTVAQTIRWPARAYGYVLEKEIYSQIDNEDWPLLNTVITGFAWILYFLAFRKETYVFTHPSPDQLVSSDLENNPIPNFISVYGIRGVARPFANTPAGHLPEIDPAIMDKLVYWIKQYIALKKELLVREGTKKSQLYKGVGNSNPFFVFYVIESMFGHIPERKLGAHITRIKCASDFSGMCNAITKGKVSDMITIRRSLLGALNSGLSKSSE